MLTLAAHCTAQSVRSALEMHFNMTHFYNTDRYQSPFELFAVTEILQVPMEILEDENLDEETMMETSTTVYKHDRVLNLFDEVEEEEEGGAIMSTTVLHVALSPVAVLHQDLDETLFSPEEDQYVTHCASSSSPILQSAFDKGHGAVACSSPMWCAEWEPFCQPPEYSACTQKSNQYPDCLMTEEFILHLDDAQQDDDLYLKDYHQDYHQTLTSSLTFDQTVPSFTTGDIHSLQEEEKLLDSYSTAAKSCEKRPLTSSEKHPSKRILAALPASPGRPLSTATNLWIDILFQSSVESLETTIKELHTWLDSTATDGDDAQQVDGPCLHGDVSSENQLNSEQLMEDKENTSTATDGDGVHGIPRLKGPEAPVVTPIEQDDDAEAVTTAREEGRVDVVFPGNVSQDGCCQFVIEILKCVLYQRQQLPMTYDQLKCSQRCQGSKQNKEEASCRAVQSTDLSWRKSERSLQELDMLLGQLEELFSLSLVPRVLLLLGGSLVLPKELYEINMEALVLSRRDRSLPVSSCLRQLFRTLLVADVFSDTAPVRLMSATILVLAHRECGVGWFRPKLDFKVPTRVKRQVIALSTTDTETLQTDWKDYVWFQAPTAFKGFSSS